jgi:hypothetical protein
LVQHGGGQLGVAIGAGKDLTVFWAVLGESEHAKASIHTGYSPYFDSGPGTNTAHSLPHHKTRMSFWQSGFFIALADNVRPRSQEFFGDKCGNFSVALKHRAADGKSDNVSNRTL